eukprot:6849975-Prymnesium_polylepis.2
MSCSLSTVQYVSIESHSAAVVFGLGHPQASWQQAGGRGTAMKSRNQDTCVGRALGGVRELCCE